MEYERISSNRYEDVIQHLRNSFFADEPLNKSVNLCSPGQGHIELEKHSLVTLNDGLSVMAITPSQEVFFLYSFISFYVLVLLFLVHTHTYNKCWCVFSSICYIFIFKKKIDCWRLVKWSAINW